MSEINRAYLRTLVKGITYATEGLLTRCKLELHNGVTIEGETHCANVEFFNKAVGEKIAKENAFAKLKDFELYHKKKL